MPLVLKTLLLFPIMLFEWNMIVAQVHYKVLSHSSLQYGLSFKAAFTIESKRLLIRLAVNGGVGTEVFSCLYPSYHLQLQLYNGGIGTVLKKPAVWPLTFDAAHSLTLTTGSIRPYRRTGNTVYADRNSPLYHFSDFSIPALQNPFKYSFSLGTNLTQAFGPGRARFQRMGFVNIHIGILQIAYSNDGTPFGKWLADEKDRYYTGDGFLAINLPNKWEINQFIVSYHKFTGYYEQAFEVANDLFLANVDYKDTTQQYFNRSVYHLSASSTTRGIGVSIDLRNKYLKDVQHLIHRNSYYVLHQVPYPYRKGITPFYFSAISHLISEK